MTDKKGEGGFYQFTGKPADITNVSNESMKAAADIARENGIDLELNSDGEKTTMTPKVVVVVPGKKE